MQYNTTQCNAMQCNVTQSNAVQYITIYRPTENVSVIDTFSSIEVAHSDDITKPNLFAASTAVMVRCPSYHETELSCQKFCILAPHFLVRSADFLWQFVSVIIVPIPQLIQFG